MPQITRCFGWKRDLPDFRDKSFISRLSAPVQLPATFDLIAKMPPIWDQSQSNSCTAHAAGTCLAYEYTKQGLPGIMPSRLFLYFNARGYTGDEDNDGGSTIRDSMKSINVYGDCPETIWPFDLAKITVKPDPTCYTAGAVHRAISYEAIDQTHDGICQTIFEGYPVCFGLTVYSSMMTEQVAQTGIIPLPGPTESMEGGHALDLVGWDDTTGEYVGRNSWGTSWGLPSKPGYFRIPQSYIHNEDLASDFWAIKLIS